MRNPTIALLAILGVCLLGSFVFVSSGAAVSLVDHKTQGTNDLSSATAASSVGLEIQKAEDFDSDSGTVSFTFTTHENATSATVTPSGKSFSGGDVDFDYVQWEEVYGGDSGSSRYFDVEGDSTYRIVYEVEAETGATEGNYGITSTVSTDKSEHTERLSANVEILEPRLTSIDSELIEITFTPDTGSETTRDVSFNIPNLGDGVMLIESIEFSDTGPYLSPSEETVPSRVPARPGGGDAVLDVEISDQIPEGTHSFTVTVEETLGGRSSFEVEVDVTKPPAAGVSERTVDLGEVLIGQRASTDFTIVERSSYDDISGLESTIENAPDNASIEFPNLNSRSVMRGDSSFQPVEIQVDKTTPQGTEFEWEVSFSPNDPEGFDTERSVTFSAEAIYPPYYDSVSLTGAGFVFDVPRDETTSYTESVRLSIKNGGDIPMSIREITASVPGNPEMDVTMVDSLTSIAPGGTESALAEVEATPASIEGEWDIQVDISAEEPTTVPSEQTGQITTRASVDVEHETEMSVDETDFGAGEIKALTETKSRTTTIEEVLGYQPVSNFSIEQISGPENGWLTIAEQPTNLSAGEVSDFTVQIAFDDKAELYETYTWEFKVDGDNVEAETITIQATPVPVDPGDTIDSLESLAAEKTGQSQTVAQEMANVLTTLEQKLEEGESTNRDDITVLFSVASSTELFLNTISDAKALIEEGEHEQAQPALVRASAAFNILSIRIDDVSDSELQSQTDIVRESADELLSDLIEQQETAFQNRFDSSDTTMLEEARIKREQARLAELSGDNERAATLRQEADETFESYSELVSSANEDLIAARELQADLDENLFLSFAGQRLFVISSLSTYNSDSDRVLELYDSAIEQFEEAGALDRAETTSQERADLESTYETAYLVSMALGAILGILVVGILAWEIRALYRYRQDSEAAVSGDFLLPWVGET